MTTETAILTVLHNITPNALLPTDRVDTLLVIPRAIKAPGSTAMSAPYNADPMKSGRPRINHTTNADKQPTATCAATTRQGESCGLRARKAWASARLSGTTGGSSASSSYPAPAARCVSESDVGRVTGFLAQPLIVRANPHPTQARIPGYACAVHFPQARRREDALPGPLRQRGWQAGQAPRHASTARSPPGVARRVLRRVGSHARW